MITLEQKVKLQALDSVLELCSTQEGEQLLDDLKQLDFYKTLQAEQPNTQVTGPLVFLANVAETASSKTFTLQCELDEVKNTLKEVLQMIEDQIYNKGDNSPSENTTTNEINQIRSRHSFLY